jgi:hypothetical protein
MPRALLALTLAATLAGSPGLLDHLRSLLASVRSASSPDEGCIMDPDGRCNPAPRADAGCGMDPDG